MKRKASSHNQPAPLVLADETRLFLTPSKIDELSATGDFQDLPIEILEVIASQLKGRDLGALACTCKYFYRTSTLIDRVAKAQVDFIPRARGIEPDTERSETWPMLSHFLQSQSAAAAQSTALSLGRYHGSGLLVEEDLEDAEDPRGGEIGLYTWGRNFYGEVGDSTFEPSSAPRRVLLGSSPYGSSEALPAVVCCGTSHSSSLSRKGDMFVWGLSSTNQLGIGGTVMELPVPKALTCFDRRRIVSVSSGTNHTLAIDENGNLWTCGQGIRGQLGHGDSPPEAPFTLLESLKPYKVVSVAAGVAHSMALTSDGSVFTWGDCSHGQLGHAAFQQAPGEFLNKPWKVQPLNPNKLSALERITAIAAGGFHSVMITVTGEVFVCGRNSYGQLGLGHTRDVWTPTKLPLDALPAPLPSGPPPSAQPSLPRVLARSSDMDTDADVVPPRPSASSPAPLVSRVVQVAGGLMHTLFLVMRAGRTEVLACGYNGSGALGTGDLAHSARLRHVQGLHGVRVTSVVCGDESSAVIGSNGEVLLWGRNGEGNLGLGDDRSRLLPTRLPRLRAVHPDRTLRRRGAKPYAPLPSRPVSDRSGGAGPSGLGPSQGRPSASSAPASSSGVQPDALWIVRALWRRSKLARVPEDVQDALTTTQNNLLAANPGEPPRPLQPALASDFACCGTNPEETSGMSEGVEQHKGAAEVCGEALSDLVVEAQEEGKGRKPSGGRRYSLNSLRDG